MPLEEVQNEKFFKEDQQIKRRRKRTNRHKESEDNSDNALQPVSTSTNIPIVEYITNSTNVNHRIYRDLLTNRRNGERVSSLNPYKE